MPRGYLEIRDELIQKGYPKEKAEEQAARIWNSENPKNPVTGNSDKKEKKDK